ncbi:MAG: hypothetical protein QM485_07545 [Flavobacteriaceae bacterium]
MKQGILINKLMLWPSCIDLLEFSLTGNSDSLKADKLITDMPRTLCKIKID